MWTDEIVWCKCSSSSQQAASNKQPASQAFEHRRYHHQSACSMQKKCSLCIAVYIVQCMFPFVNMSPWLHVSSTQAQFIWSLILYLWSLFVFMCRFIYLRTAHCAQPIFFIHFFPSTGEKLITVDSIRRLNRDANWHWRRNRCHVAHAIMPLSKLSNKCTLKVTYSLSTLCVCVFSFISYQLMPFLGRFFCVRVILFQASLLPTIVSCVMPSNLIPSKRFGLKWQARNSSFFFSHSLDRYNLVEWLWRFWIFLSIYL